MGNVERKRRTTEGKTLAKYRRTDCRQLAVYVKDGNNRTLCGFVNDYDGVMWWHDVTTSGKVGRPIRIESLAPATLYEFAGVVCGSQFHVFAQRF